jgi:hypothetical protein
MKLEIFQQVFLKYPNIEFHEYPASGSRVVPCRQTEMMKLIVAFPNYRNTSKNDNKLKPPPQISPHVLDLNVLSNTAETGKLSESHDISVIISYKVMGWTTEELSFDLHKQLPHLQNIQTEISGL